MDDGDGSKKGSSYEQDSLALTGMELSDEEDHMRTNGAEKERKGETEGERGMTVLLLEEPSEEDTAVVETTDAINDPELTIISLDGELKMIPLDAIRDDGNEDPGVDCIPQDLETLRLEMPRDGSQTDEKKASFLMDALKEFAGTTTMHGAPKIILARNPVKLIVWLLVFVGCWATFIYQTILVCDNYFKYPKKIDLEIRVSPLPYPAITFCNKRGVSFFDSETWRLGKRHHIKKYSYKSIPRVAAEFQKPEIAEIIENSAIPKEEFFVDVQMEYKLDDGRIEMNYIGGTFEYLEEVWGGKMFKCYTLTIPEYHRQSRIKRISGVVMAGHGMMSDEKDYVWGNRQRGGLRIYIHPAGTRIYPQFQKYYDDYHEVKPNKHARLHIKFKNTVRVGQPHGNCTEVNPFLQNKTDNVYTLLECKLLCQSSQYLQQTGKVNIHHLPLDNMNCLGDEEVEDWMDDIVSICYTYTPGVFTKDKALNRWAKGWVCWFNCKRCQSLVDGRLLLGLPTSDICVTWMEEKRTETICLGREDELLRLPLIANHYKRFCNISTPGTGGETIVRTLRTTADDEYDEDEKFQFNAEDCGCHSPCNDVTYDVLQVDSEQPSEFSLDGQSQELKNIFKHELSSRLGKLAVHTNYSGRFRSRIPKSDIWSDIGDADFVEFPENDDDKFFFIDSYIWNNTEKALKDLATFEIIFPDYSIPTVIESPLYTPTQFISEIGGQLGIWIGVSAITLTEVIEFLISVLCEMFQSRKTREREMKKEETGDVDQH